MYNLYIVLSILSVALLTTNIENAAQNITKPHSGHHTTKMPELEKSTTISATKESLMYTNFVKSKTVSYENPTLNSKISNEEFVQKDNQGKKPKLTETSTRSVEPHPVTFKGTTNDYATNPKIYLTKTTKVPQVMKITEKIQIKTTSLTMISMNPKSEQFVTINSKNTLSVGENRTENNNLFVEQKNKNVTQPILTDRKIQHSDAVNDEIKISPSDISINKTISKSNNVDVHVFTNNEPKRKEFEKIPEHVIKKTYTTTILTTFTNLQMAKDLMKGIKNIKPGNDVDNQTTLTEIGRSGPNKKKSNGSLSQFNIKCGYAILILMTSILRISDIFNN